jgi:hypothetical protein
MSGSQEESSGDQVAALEFEDEKRAMSAKDLFGILFSASALVISAASYYVSNVRVDNDASARVTDMRVEAVNAEDSLNGYKSGNIVVKVTFVNAGNRPAIVTKATFQLSDRPDLSNGGFGDEAITADGTFPILIAPKDLRLVNLKIPLKFAIASFDSGAKLPGKADSDLRRLFAGFRYDAIDSSGALHSSWSGMEIAIDVSKDRWKGLGKANQRQPFSLTPLLR